MVRVLVVDDFRPFRQVVCSILGKIPALRIVGEASDGLEAVRRSEELQPDLILLDIGMPELNGIEAARQIRKVSPDSRIIFVTQEASPQMIQETADLGAWGYVVKTRAAKDITAAVNAVLQGGHFVSSLLPRPRLAEPVSID